MQEINNRWKLPVLPREKKAANINSTKMELLTLYSEEVTFDRTSALISNPSTIFYLILPT